MLSEKENALHIAWEDHCNLSCISDAPIRDTLAPNTLPVTNCSLQNPWLVPTTKLHQHFSRPSKAMDEPTLHYIHTGRTDTAFPGLHIIILTGRKVILKHRVNTLTTDRGQKHHEQLRGVLVPWCSLAELVAIWCVDRASQMSEAHSYWTVLQTGGGGKKKKVDSVKSAVSQKGRNKVVYDTIVSETSCIIHSTCTQTGYLHSS